MNIRGCKHDKYFVKFSFLTLAGLTQDHLVQDGDVIKDFLREDGSVPTPEGSPTPDESMLVYDFTHTMSPRYTMATYDPSSETWEEEQV